MRVALWFSIAVSLAAAPLRAQDGASDASSGNSPGYSGASGTEWWGDSPAPPATRRGSRVTRLAREIGAGDSTQSQSSGTAPASTTSANPSFDNNGRLRYATSFGYGRAAPGGYGTNAAASGAQPYSTFNRANPSGIEPAAGENDLGDGQTEPPPTRTAQVPDIFRTPNPTPLEQPNPYAPQLVPGQDQFPSMPSTKPEPPLPPLAPLVNMRFTDTWLGASKQNMGMNDIDMRGTLAMGRTGVFVTPGYGMHFLNGPTSTDLPSTLYDAYVDIRWNKKIDDQWAFELAFTPSFYSDLDNTSSDAWRFITTALGFYQLNPETQLMAGIMYLDRFDINWFPIFGVIFADPDSDWRYEVVFPRPKFARRVLHGEDKDGWVYLAGEFGGGAWAVQRTTGANDMVAIRDWRIMLGYETKVKDFSALSWFAEAGYVFHRQVEFRSGFGNFNPDSCGMLRFGVSY